MCFFTAKVLHGYTTKCWRYADARASFLRTWSAKLTTCPRSCFLSSRASVSQFFSGSVRHLLRAGGLVVFCRLLPASPPLELRMSWRRAAPSSPTVEAFREVVQSQREAIRAVMEARPAEKKPREGGSS
jgi:hypothetical protein